MRPNPFDKLEILAGTVGTLMLIPPGLVAEVIMRAWRVIRGR